MAKFVFSAFADEASPNLSEQIVACKENGITHIEVRKINMVNISDFDTESILPVKKELDESGIKISSLGSPYGKIKITEDFEPHFEKFKKSVDVAKVLGAKYIRMFSFYFQDGESFDEYREEVLNRLDKMITYAEQNGIICCHENEKEIYGDIAVRCLDILKHFNGRLKAVFDPANFIQCGQDVLEAYEMLEPYIEYIHIKDCVYETGVVVPAGKGDGNVEEVLRRYKAYATGERFLSLEPHLKVFSGLEELEGGAKTNMDDNVYPTNRDAFNAASNALKEVLKRI